MLFAWRETAPIFGFNLHIFLCFVLFSRTPNPTGIKSCYKDTFDVTYETFVQIPNPRLVLVPNFQNTPTFGLRNGCRCWPHVGCTNRRHTTMMRRRNHATYMVVYHLDRAITALILVSMVVLVSMIVPRTTNAFMFPSTPQSITTLGRNTKWDRTNHVLLSSSSLQQQTPMERHNEMTFAATNTSVPLSSSSPSSSKRDMLSFAIPALGIYLCNPLLSNMDNAFVGRTMGTVGLAALSPATICIDQMLYLFNFLGRATTGIVTRAYFSSLNNNQNSSNDHEDEIKSSATTPVLNGGNTLAARDAASARTLNYLYRVFQCSTEQ